MRRLRPAAIPPSHACLSGVRESGVSVALSRPPRAGSAVLLLKYTALPARGGRPRKSRSPQRRKLKEGGNRVFDFRADFWPGRPINQRLLRGVTLDAMGLGWEGWFSLGVVALCFGLLAFSRAAPDLVTAAGLTLLQGTVQPLSSAGGTLRRICSPQHPRDAGACTARPPSAPQSRVDGASHPLSPSLPSQPGRLRWLGFPIRFQTLPRYTRTGVAVG